MDTFPRTQSLRIPPKNSVGSIRVDQKVEAPASAVWERIADAGSIADWFPGFSSSFMVGDSWERRVLSNVGIETIEDVVNIDAATRRFQYRIRPNFLVKEHLATVDVIALSDTSCMVTYSTEMQPRALALAISSGTRDALAELKRQVEQELRAESRAELQAELQAELISESTK